MSEKFLLHLKNGTIHLTQPECRHIRWMREGNKKFFNTYDEALNFFEGDTKGHPCGTCHPDREK